MYIYILFNIIPFCVRFMVGTLVLGQVFIRVLQFFSPVSNIPLMHLNAALSRRTNGRYLGTSNKQWCFRYRGRMDIAVPHFSVFRWLVWKHWVLTPVRWILFMALYTKILC